MLLNHIGRAGALYYEKIAFFVSPPLAENIFHASMWDSLVVLQGRDNKSLEYKYGSLPFQDK
jgi:hypothetical protein